MTGERRQHELSQQRRGARHALRSLGPQLVDEQRRRLRRARLRRQTATGARCKDRLTGGVGADSITTGAGDDVLAVDSPSDLTDIATNITVTASGLAVDVVTDFTTNSDAFFIDGTGFGLVNPSLVEIAGDYDGTNSGQASGDHFIFDGTHLIYDEDVTSAGYSVVARVEGDSVAQGDLLIGLGGPS